MATLPYEETPIFDALRKEYAAKEAYDLHFPEENPPNDDKSD